MLPIKYDEPMDSALKVTITLSEYRELVTSNATSRQRIADLERQIKELTGVKPLNTEPLGVD